jgi:hypothetical protein
MFLPPPPFTLSRHRSRRYRHNAADNQVNHRMRSTGDELVRAGQKGRGADRAIQSCLGIRPPSWPVSSGIVAHFGLARSIQFLVTGAGNRPVKRLCVSIWDWNAIPDLFSGKAGYAGMSMQIATNLNGDVAAIGPIPMRGARHDAYVFGRPALKTCWKNHGTRMKPQPISAISV